MSFSKASYEVFHYGFLQKMRLNPQETADLVIFTEEILIGKLHFCTVHIITESLKTGYKSIFADHPTIP